MGESICEEATQTERKINLTFAHKGWDLEIEDFIGGAVGHLVVFHVVEQRFFCYLFLQLCGGRQFQEGAEPAEFSLSVLPKNVTVIMLLWQSDKTKPKNPPTSFRSS